MKGKRAQIQTQIFIYIMILIVGAGILILGYNSIQGIINQGNQVLELKFQNSFTNDVKSLSYMQQKPGEYYLPSSIEKVCFKSMYAKGEDADAVVYSALGRSNPIIENALASNTDQNVFLYPTGAGGFSTGISIDLGTTILPKGTSPVSLEFACFNVTAGNLNLIIKGQGSSVLITG